MVLTAENCKPPSALPFRVNAWEDLCCFEETERWHNKEQFLKAARQRLDEGLNCVTLVQDGKLAFIDWINLSSTESTFGYVGQTVQFLPHSSAQFSAYVHPVFRRRGLFTDGLAHVARFIFEKSDTRYAMAGVHSDNLPAVKGHLVIGFETVALLETKRRLGRTRYAAHLCSPHLILRPIGTDGVWQVAQLARL